MIQKQAPFTLTSRLTGLERNTIVVINDHRVQDSDSIAAVHVPAVGVGRLVRGVGHGVDVYVVIDDVQALVEQVVPLWTIDHVDILDQDILRLEDSQCDGAEEGRVSCAIVTV